MDEIESKADRKQQFILERSKPVFMEKGYQSVTMSDLVKACGISRGGLYRYFKSTKNVFMAVLKMNQQDGKNTLIQGMENGIQAANLLEAFFQGEKKNLLRQEPSLTLAIYEFYFSHKKDLKENWLQEQFIEAEGIITRLINYGICKKEFYTNEANEIARNILFMLEGLRISAEVMEVDETTIEDQFDLIKKQLVKEKG